MRRMTASTGGRASVVVVREQHVGARAQAFEARSALFGAFDFEVDGLGAGGDGGFENAQLLFDAAVEASHDSGGGGRWRESTQSVWRARNLRMAATPCSGLRQVVQTELEEALAGLVFATRVRQQGLGVGEAQRNADARKGECVAAFEARTAYHVKGGG